MTSCIVYHNFCSLSSPKSSFSGCSGDALRLFRTASGHTSAPLHSTVAGLLGGILAEGPRTVSMWDRPEREGFGQVRCSQPYATVGGGMSRTDICTPRGYSGRTSNLRHSRSESTAPGMRAMNSKLGCRRPRTDQAWCQNEIRISCCVPSDDMARDLSSLLRFIIKQEKPDAHFHA